MKVFPCLVALLAFCACTSPTPTSPVDPFDALITQHSRFDVWITGGHVIDGTGTPAYQADLLLLDDSIVFIGKVDPSRMEVRDTLDATQKIVSPGFIDVHAHGDPLRQAAFQNFLAMGVSTICLGQDGFSPPRADIGTWMKEVEHQGVGTNIALFAGHNTLRELSGIGYDTLPPAEGMRRMKALLATHFDAGCFGLSTGLEYDPGRLAKREELEALAQLTGQYQRMIMSHIRNEDDVALLASLRELLQQGQHCPVHVSHIKSVYGKGSARAKAIIALLDSARTAGQKVSADLYPYMASYTTIGIVFPDWARPPQDYREVLRTHRPALAQYLRRRIAQRNGPEATLFGTAPYTGKTLAALAKESGRPFEEILMDRITPQGASAAYFIMDDSLQSALLATPWIMLSSDGSPSMHHPRGYGSFAKMIETYVLGRNLLSLEQAIHKMSGLPAQTLGLQKRGTISRGFKADLLIFDPKRIQAKASYAEPHQLAVGMEIVLVNGKVALQSDTFSPLLYGKVLKSPTP